MNHGAWCLSLLVMARDEWQLQARSDEVLDWLTSAQERRERREQGLVMFHGDDHFLAFPRLDNHPRTDTARVSGGVTLVGKKFYN